MPQLEGQPGSRGMNPPGGVSTINLYNWSEPAQSTAPPRRNNPTNDDNVSWSANDNSASRSAAGLCESNNSRSIARMHQVPGGTSTITFGVQASAEENEASMKRRPGYDEKRKELYGSGIFNETSGSSDGDFGYGGFYKTTVGDNQQPRGRIQSDAKHKELFGSKPNDFQEPRCRPTSDAKSKELNGSNIFGYSNYEYHPPSVRSALQEPEEQKFPRRNWTNNNPPSGVSQGSYGADDQLESPKRPTSNSEAAKQRELSGSNDNLNDLTGRLSFSNAKAREMAGDNIFGPPPEAAKMVQNREPAGKRSQLMLNNQEEQPDPYSQRKHEMKSAELSGNNIFHDGSNSGDEIPQQYHQRSMAKVREMSGSDIFSNDQPRARNTVGGIRKPPGGGSTIMLS